MKKLSLYLIAVIYIFSLSACHQEKNELAHSHEHNHSHSESASEHDHEEHEEHGEIVLEPEMAEKFGVAVESITPGIFSDVIKVTGQFVNDPGSTSDIVAPTSGIVTLSNNVSVGTHITKGAIIATINSTPISGGDPNRAAKVAIDAAKREVDRLKPLLDDGIVSMRDYNAALQVYEQACAAYSPTAASGKVVAPASGVITQVNVAQGSYVDAGTVIATIIDSQQLILRADVPEKHFAKISGFADANIRLPYSSDIISISQLGGKRVSNNNIGSTSMPGYMPIFFKLPSSADFSAVPGGSVEIYLLGQPRENVVTVPNEAISEQQGNFFVYEQLDEECYRKVPVRTGYTDGRRIEILEGLHGDENIVVKAVTAVRLAETSAVAPEGHSHNH